MEINIRHATPADISVLADLNRLAYLRETIAMFVFTNWPAPEGMKKFFTARMTDRFNHPETLIFKAVNPSTGDILGFICWTLERKGEEEGGFPEPGTAPRAVGAQAASVGLNMDFLVYLTQPIDQMKTHMKGSDHYCKYTGIDRWKLADPNDTKMFPLLSFTQIIRARALVPS